MVLRLMFILQFCCAMPFFVKVETDQSCKFNPFKKKTICIPLENI